MNKPTRLAFEGVMRRVLFLCALAASLSVLFITVFIFQQGLPVFQSVPPAEFLLGTDWRPTASPVPRYQILPFIAGSFLVTGVAVAIGVPVGLACGVFMAEVASGRLSRALRGVVDLLAGIPSVVYGFFAAVFISRLIRDLFGGTGYGVLAAGLVVAIMILPTIITVTETSLRAVPDEYREASAAIGATPAQTISRVLLPAARTGIMAGVVLAVGRAMGETMAVLMVGGNAPIMPTGLLSKVRTLTMNIATDMGYASGTHLTALFATGMALFVVIMLTNLAVLFITRRAARGLR
jgi:phosphate transport system permease protein